MTLDPDPFDPDADLDSPPAAPASGVHALPPRLEELLAENREALRESAPTIRVGPRLRSRAANALEDFGCWWARGYWGFVRVVRGH